MDAAFYAVCLQYSNSYMQYGCNNLATEYITTRAWNQGQFVTQ